jgi:hypothetical protein
MEVVCNLSFTYNNQQLAPQMRYKTEKEITAYFQKQHFLHGAKGLFFETLR